MVVSDLNYMHRVWLLDVDYLKADRIKNMQNENEVLGRLESTGASLALSAVTVDAKYIDEDEVRLLYNVEFNPLVSGAILDDSCGLVRIPFDWHGFVNEREERP